MDTIISELQSVLNDSANASMHANEENLSFVHGYFVGISQGIAAMGYYCEWRNDYGRFIVGKDPYKQADSKTYAAYLTRIIENHFSLYIKGNEPEHEQAIMDGMEEVLRICGYTLNKQFGIQGFSVHKTIPSRS